MAKQKSKPTKKQKQKISGAKVTAKRGAVPVGAKVTVHHHTEVNEDPFAGETILSPQDAQPLMGTGSADTWDYQPDPQVSDVLAETEDVDTASDELAQELRADPNKSPVLSGGDIDADWQDAEEDGEETVGGEVATPDQNRVDELGEAVGLVYQAEEPLDTEDKLQKRDRMRWELNPASAERDKV